VLVENVAKLDQPTLRPTRTLDLLMKGRVLGASSLTRHFEQAIGGRDARLHHLVRRREQPTKRIVYGLVFGIHEALDQFGAMFGPLLVALILANRGSYHEAFAVLLVPALINLAFVAIARCYTHARKTANSIVVSGFARELCREEDEARFVALGERRFKGFADKAQVFRFEWRG
jgi:hypothetical protein